MRLLRHCMRLYETITSLCCVESRFPIIFKTDVFIKFLNLRLKSVCLSLKSIPHYISILHNDSYSNNS